MASSAGRRKNRPRFRSMVNRNGYPSHLQIRTAPQSGERSSEGPSVGLKHVETWRRALSRQSSSLVRPFLGPRRRIPGGLDSRGGRLLSALLLSTGPEGDCRSPLLTGSRDKYVHHSCRIHVSVTLEWGIEHYPYIFADLPVLANQWPLRQSNPNCALFRVNHAEGSWN